MKTKTLPTKPFSRRTLLKGALAGTAGIPLLDAHRATGQNETPPTRMIVFATPNGTRNDLFWPSGSGGSLSFPEYTAPLAPFQDKLLFLDGITHCPAVVGDNGFAGGLNGSEHARGIGGLLTARPLGTGTFQSFMATSGWGSGVSLDQHLADIMDLPTRFKTLELGVHVRDNEVRGRISYTGADQPVPPREDPADVFDALFADASPDPGMGEMTGGDPALAQLRAERRSVFDITAREIQRLQNSLGAEDRVKLEAHLDSIRSIEERLAGEPTGGNTGGSVSGCQIPTGDMAVNLNDEGSMVRTGELQMDLAAAALACDQTRIITIQWNYAESEHLFPWLELNRNHHAISHDWAGSTGFEEYGQIHVWFAEQLAYLLGKLDSYQEGDGTLLDNTVVFWGSEIGESTGHDLTRMPYVLAGGGGGKLDTGKVVTYSPRQDNNKLLVSLAQIMGATEVTQFGDESGETGTLPDIFV